MKFAKFAKKWLTPFGLLLLGLLSLMLLNQIYVAGVCFSLGIVMIIFFVYTREEGEGIGLFSTLWKLLHTTIPHNSHVSWGQ